jgi:hypothetical protein
MASKQCLQALLTSIAHEHVHVRTYGRTNEELLTLIAYVTFRIARRGAAKNA